MGIKGYFRNIICKYDKTHGWREGPHDHFLLDFNSIIYGAHAQATMENTNSKNFAKTVIKYVIAEIDELVNLVKPTKTLFIAMDGTVPMGKAVKSRARRFKEVKRNILFNELDIPISENPLPTALFTPGTDFMNDLSKAIKKMTFPKIKNVIISDSNEAGEGEHKIMPFLRELAQNKKNKSQKTVILSPDADMIVLALMSGAPNISIMKIVAQTQELMDQYPEQKYIYFFVDELASAFLQETGAIHLKIPPMNLYYDYALCVSLTGNDFVHALKYLQLTGKADYAGTGKRISALDFVMEVYIKLLHEFKEPMTTITKTGVSINRSFFLKLITGVASAEENGFRQIQRKRDMNRRKSSLNDRETAQFKEKSDVEVKKQIFEHFEFTRPQHPLYDRYNPRFDKINFYDKEWIKKYYMTHLEISEAELPTFIKRCCHEYMLSLQWTMDYYVNGCPDTEWYNPFDIPPLMSSLVDYITSEIKTPVISISAEFKKKTKFMTPHQQLLVVLPPQLAGFLPEKLRPLVLSPDSPIIDMYPWDFDIDVINGYKWIYTEPILPNVQLNRILKAYSEVK
jgi:5'-3' exonuclease